MAEHTLPFDELNALEAYISAVFKARDNGIMTAREAEEDIIDELLDLYLLAYENGARYASETLGEDIPIDRDRMEAAVYEKIAGRDFVERVREYVEDGTVADIIRVADTDETRIYNEGIVDTAEQSDQMVFKRWNTMLDDRVRDTHEYLEGNIVPLNRAFYTYDGDNAMYPGGFTLPQNNVNCRCVIDLIV